MPNTPDSIHVPLKFGSTVRGEVDGPLRVPCQLKKPFIDGAYQLYIENSKLKMIELWARPITVVIG